MDLPDGACTGSACRWLGVPFAEPLTKRFAPSVPKRILTVSDLNLKSAGGGKYGPTCYQFMEGVTDYQSEDCLTLNIWSPSKGKEKLPVMVWIHGGGFVFGSASMSFSSLGMPGDPSVHLYDGTNLAKHDVVVVVIQYRLGPFGFLPFGGGDEMGSNVTTGESNGLGDQISALKWVQMHINRFGGDPNQVTIFGESSGSVSTCALLHSPAAKGLFHRAILQSGSCYPSLDYIFTKEEALFARNDYLQKISKYDLNLETAPAEEIVRRTMEAYGDWLNVMKLGAPSVDGVILPDLPVHLTPHDGVDLLVGVTSFDQTVSSIPNGREDFLAKFGLLTGKNVVALEEAYGDKDDADLFMDGCIRCQSQRVIQRASEVGSGSGKYWYMYDCPHKAAPHGSDMAAVFGNIDWKAYESPFLQEMFGPPPPTGLIGRMQAAWVAFAKSGDSGWADANTGMGASFGCNSTTVEPLMDEFGTCDLWTIAADSVGPLAVGSICTQYAYADMAGDVQQPSHSWYPGVLVAAAVCLVCFISWYLRSRRRAGYSKVADDSVIIY